VHGGDEGLGAFGVAIVVRRCGAVRTHSVRPDHRCHNRAVCSMAMRALAGDAAARNRAATGAL